MTGDSDPIASPAVRAPRRRPDGWSAFFALILLAGVVVLDTLRELAFAYEDFIAFPFELLIMLGMVVFVLVSVTYNMFARRWRRSASAVLAPFAAFGVAYGVISAGVTPTTVRFQIVRQSYEGLVSQALASGDRRPLLLAFEWGELGGAAQTNVFGTLIYDESDEIAKPPSARSSRWRDRPDAAPGHRLYSVVNPNPDPLWAHDVQPLGGHFYLLTDTYPASPK